LVQPALEGRLQNELTITRSHPPSPILPIKGFDFRIVKDLWSQARCSCNGRRVVVRWSVTWGSAESNLTKDEVFE